MSNTLVMFSAMGENLVLERVVGFWEYNTGLPGWKERELQSDSLETFAHGRCTLHRVDSCELFLRYLVNTAISVHRKCSRGEASAQPAQIWPSDGMTDTRKERRFARHMSDTLSTWPILKTHKPTVTSMRLNAQTSGGQRCSLQVGTIVTGPA
ncbi:hypothetical protein BDV97DRAFT_353971 [Delphinella strobiligena]|nr:hypothetical protein BDV97DRAFT_353971 [Delphinella strobiligena]